MYLGGIIVFGTNLVVTVVIIIAAMLFWRAGYFENEEPKYRMLLDDDER